MLFMHLIQFLENYTQNRLDPGLFFAVAKYFLMLFLTDEMVKTILMSKGVIKNKSINKVI